MLKLLQDVVSSTEVSKAGAQEEGGEKDASGVGGVSGRRTPSPSRSTGTQLQIAGPSTDIPATEPKSPGGGGGGSGGLSMLGLGAAFGFSKVVTEPVPAVPPVGGGSGDGKGHGGSDPPRGGEVISMQTI